MKIGSRQIGNGQPCYIIAEAGTGYCHEDGTERIWRAIHLAGRARTAGADAVKFQMFCRDEPLFCPMPGDDKRWERWNSCMIALEGWKRVKQHCDEVGITFLASAFQVNTVRWLLKLNVAAYKVASRAAATYPYDAVPGPFIISNGLDVVLPFAGDGREWAWLQCVMQYPTPLKEARWWMAMKIAGSLPLTGLSDHSGTVWPGLDAMARGCPMLEVHFAVPEFDAGNDAPVCLTIDQLKLLCEARNGFAALRSH